MSNVPRTPMLGVTSVTRNVPIRHGYTLAVIHELTLVAVRCELFYRSRSYADRIDIAWSAIVEHLYASEDVPSRRDLVNTGMTAISNWFVSEARTHGVNSSQWGRTTTPGVNFERYWRVFTGPTPSPEERIVERLAVAQIWCELSPHIRKVITALAAHGDYHQAARSLGKTPDQLYSQIAYARRIFFSMWHEGEEPSHSWGHDRRSRRKQATGGRTAQIMRQRRAKAVRYGQAGRDTSWNIPLAQ